MSKLTEAEFMRAPMEWPRWPCLPLKRHLNGAVQFGFLLAQEDMLTTVHFGSIFRAEVVNNAAMRQIECIDYVTVDDIIADGWKID